MRHDYIALRFVHQTTLRNLAHLYVSPKPRSLTRIFMVFQGVQAGDVYAWKHAEQKAKLGGTLWRAVIGILRPIDCPSCLDVVEIGGMEVGRCTLGPGLE